MSKSYENKIFRITDEEFQLDIYASADVQLNLPSIVEIDKSCILSMNYDYEFDTYPVGLQSTPKLEIEFALEYTTNEFVQMLFEPFADLSNGIVSGNIFVYKRRLPSVGYVEMFTGIQKNGAENGYDSADNIFKVEVYHYVRVVYENYLTKDLQNYDGAVSEYEKTQLLNDVFGVNIVEGGETINTFQHNIQILKDYELALISNIENYIKTQLDLIATSILRKSTTCSFTFALPDFYTQTGVGERGSLVSNPAVISNIVDTNEGFCNVNGIANYYENLYDFANDHYAAMLKRAVYREDGIEVLDLLVDFISSDVIKDEITDNEITFTPQHKILKKANIENQSAVESDITKYEQVRAGSRSEETYNVSMLLNNIPTFDKDKRISKSLSSTYISNQIDVFKFYNSVSRVHEYCKFDLGNTDTDALLNLSYVDYFRSINLPFSIQQKQGIFYIVSKAVLDLYSRKNQSLIKLTLDYDRETIALLNSRLRFTVDLNNINPSSDAGVVDVFSEYSNNFYIVKFSYDIIEQKIEIEGFSYGT